MRTRPKTSRVQSCQPRLLTWCADRTVLYLPCPAVQPESTISNLQTALALYGCTHHEWLREPTHDMVGWGIQLGGEAETHCCRSRGLRRCVHQRGYAWQAASEWAGGLSDRASAADTWRQGRLHLRRPTRCPTRTAFPVTAELPARLGAACSDHHLPGHPKPRQHQVRCTGGQQDQRLGCRVANARLASAPHARPPDRSSWLPCLPTRPACPPASRIRRSGGRCTRPAAESTCWAPSRWCTPASWLHGCVVALTVRCCSGCGRCCRA